MNKLQTLREIMKKKHIDALLVSNFYNILYLTDFKTLAPEEREAFVLVTQKHIYLMTDSRYVDENLDKAVKANDLTFCLLSPGAGLLQYIQTAVEKEDVQNLGFESENLKYYEYHRIKQALNTVNFVPTDYLIIPIRDVKTAEEIKTIEKACDIGDQCLEDISKIMKEGMTEKEVAFKIEFWLKEKGYDMSFDPIVAYDEHAAIAHYNTKEGHGKLKKGTTVLIDMGVKYQNYCSDITRMFFYKEVKDYVRNAYEIVLKAQNESIKKSTLAITPKELDETCREAITSKGLPNFAHSLGHGVGLEIHEFPKVSMYSNDVFLENQVYTIEPGVYVEGKYGIRIEDTVVMEKNGARVLTKFPKDMRIL